MLRRVIWTVVAFPIGIVLVTLAVTNGHRVRLVLDPFRPDEPVLSLVLPFYALPVRRAAGRHRASAAWSCG